jgi:hypothetical protein
VSRAENLPDLMYDKLSVTVAQDMDYYRQKFSDQGNPYSREFMVRFDPMIRAALL